MKAMVRDAYGSPDQLRLEDVPAPSPADGEVVVKVRAVAVNKGDWEILRGTPLWVRLAGFGLFKPRHRILGSNFAGHVIAVGRQVTLFRVGDEVLGDAQEHGLGGFAEVMRVPETAAIVHKPADLSFEAAASLPEAGLIALQALRGKRPVTPGQHVLIIGAGGGGGSFAIQLAKSLGANVTAVDRGEKVALMRALGADHVVDHTREDFATRPLQYDLVLDLVGVRSISTWKQLLRPGGRYLAVGGSMAHLLKTLLLGMWSTWTSRKSIGVLAVNFNKQDLIAVVDLVTSGTVAATIERTYPLHALPDALRHLGAGLSKGKLVITLEEADPA